MNDPRFRTKPAYQNGVGIGVVLISALLIGLAPNAAKIAYQEGANPLAVITFRTLIGVAGLALYLLARDQWPRASPGKFRDSAFAGLAQVLTAFGLLGAVAYIDVSLAALIFYFHPFLIAIIGNFRGDMAMSPGRFLYILAAIAGLALVFGVTFDTLNPLGIGLSLLGMVSITALIFIVSGISKSIGPIQANLYMTVWSLVFLSILAVIGPAIGVLENMSLPGSVTGWVAITSAGVTTTAGYVLFFVGARMIGTTRAALWTLTEPIFAILLAILLVSEWLSAIQWLGVALVIGSLIRFETADTR